MILYTAPRSIGPLCVPTDVGKGAGALSGSFEGARPPRGLGRDPGKDVKGNGFWRSARNPALMRWDVAITAAKVLWSPGSYTRPCRILWLNPYLKWCTRVSLFQFSRADKIKNLA